MRRDSNTVLATTDGEPAFAHDVEGELVSAEREERGSPPTLDVDSRPEGALVRDVKRLVDDLAHDLRQPLSTMTMNLQSAIRCLRSHEPRVPSALEALTECLDVESELVTLVMTLQQYLSDEAPNVWFSLNDLARDTYESLVALEFDSRRIAQRLADPPPYVSGVDSWALHKGILGIARRLLAREERNASSADVACLDIGTRRTSEQAELRLGGIQCGDMPDDIQSILECARGVAGLSRGKASIELGPRMATIVISFPAWTVERRRVARKQINGA